MENYRQSHLVRCKVQVELQYQICFYKYRDTTKVFRSQLSKHDLTLVTIVYLLLLCGHHRHGKLSTTTPSKSKTTQILVMRKTDIDPFSGMCGSLFGVY